MVALLRELTQLALGQHGELVTRQYRCGITAGRTSEDAMRRATKRCSTPGCADEAGPSGYCPRDQAKQQRARHRTTPTKRARTTEVRRHRAKTILDHLEANGGRAHCPGWGVPPHEVAPEDLTADDPTPIARGGDPLQPVVPMCRSCNGRKGAR